MRRSEKQILNLEVIDDIIKKAQVCRLGMCHNNKPYVLPMNFGYDGQAFYLHSSKIGQKIDILKDNNQVVIEIDEAHQLITGENGCDYTMNFASVIANGTANIMEDDQDKIEGLNIIMKQYDDSRAFTYNQKALDRVCIIKIIVTEITGKHSMK